MRAAAEVPRVMVLEPRGMDGRWRVQVVEGRERETLSGGFEHSESALGLARSIARRRRAVIVLVQAGGQTTLLEDFSGTVGDRGGDFDFT